jgi:hypothetical protein
MNQQAYRFISSHSAASADLRDSTCWYCDHPLVDGRRFCDKACAEAFEDDELAVERKVLGRLREPDAAFM